MADKETKKAKGEGAKKEKSAKPKKANIFARMGKGIANFFKSFRAEIKKITWPEAKTIWKNTGIVLLMVLVVGLAIYGVDRGLAALLKLISSFK